jgi:hypothetical protein
VIFYQALESREIIIRSPKPPTFLSTSMRVRLFIDDFQGVGCDNRDSVGANVNMGKLAEQYCLSPR